QSEANRRGFAYARLGALYSRTNVKAPLNAFAVMVTQQPYGPYFSLDGMHPSAAGQAVIANEAARGLNARYGFGIPENPAALVSATLATAPTPPGLTKDDAENLGRTEGWEGGAFVLNSGEGKPDAFCHFRGLSATRVTLVRTPSGNWSLSCSFENLAPIAERQ